MLLPMLLAALIRALGHLSHGWDVIFSSVKCHHLGEEIMEQGNVKPQPTAKKKSSRKKEVTDLESNPSFRSWLFSKHELVEKTAGLVVLVAELITLGHELYQ